MVKARSYKLLCPIARALDRVGDRWTLLILRDLHAGPARFTDLQRGLTGIAANLLTERLAKLVADGLVVQAPGPHAATVYELTELGRKTRSLIFELAMFGGGLPHEGEPVAPGNLRTVAVTLGAAAERVEAWGFDLVSGLVVDGENMEISAKEGVASVFYRKAEQPDVVLTTSYESIMQLSDGALSEREFIKQESQVEIVTPGKDKELYRLFARILEAFR
ncbi:MAG: winged helix-turn-helix transcriptional regulator [Cohaesibacteraceae bacterium]